jgi:hypothetical protein
MGSAGDKPRKRRSKEPHVPRYEEPNQLEGAVGGSGFGRYGHGSEHRPPAKPGRAGSFLLRILGQKPKQ